MKATVKLLSNEQQKNDVSTTLAVTDDGKDLIGDLPMKSPECLELVMEYYSEDDE
jgi:hypothetical protein